MSARLQAAYSPQRLRGGAAAVARIGRRSAAIDALLRRLGARQGGFVGAWNPFSRRMPRGWNDRMLARLREAARRLPQAEGSGGDGRWREQHLLLAADPRRLAVLAPPLPPGRHRHGPARRAGAAGAAAAPRHRLSPTRNGGNAMPRLDRIEAGHYRIPLPEVLTDSTHGAMADFELITCRVTDADGAEGVGYTYTVGRNGGAVHHILAHEIAELAAGAGRRPDRGAVAARVVGAALRRPRRAGGAGAIRLRHRALGPQGEAGRDARCGGCSAGMTRACPAMPAASTSTSRPRR